MDQFRLLRLFSVFYVASVMVGIGYANKVDDDKSWMSAYWSSALPNSPLPSKAVQQILNPAEIRKGYTGIGKEAMNLSASPLVINTYGRSGYGIVSEGKIRTKGLTTFFLGKDLQQLGKKMTLQLFKPTSSKATLLPRQVAKSIPFSSTKFSEILTHFGVKPESVEARAMEWTLKECEAPATKGEAKYCATSLESLIDFTVSKIGRYVQVYSTEADSESKQVYTIDTSGVESIGDSNFVACHKQNYIYGVFYCHKFSGTTTKAYMVPLVGADGVTKAKAVAICHTDTSGWNPKHMAFQVLKIKPGNTIPVCHFQSPTGLLWVPM